MSGPGPFARVYRGAPIPPEPDRLEQYLHWWARLERGGHFERWYPGKSVGMISGGASEMFDEICDRSEREVAKVVDVIINGDSGGAGLPEPQRRALLHTYLHAVFHYRDLGALSRALAMAKDSLRARLKARHLL